MKGMESGTCTVIGKCERNGVWYMSSNWKVNHNEFGCGNEVGRGH